MKNIFEQHLAHIQSAMPDLIVDLTVTSRRFFDDSWTNQGFTDTVLTPWKKSYDRHRQLKDKTLIETGALRRSLRAEIIGNEGYVYSELPYAEIHNEGGTIKAQQSIRAHTRKVKGKVATVKSHMRAVNTNMPQRQFMGQSAQLDAICEDIIVAKLNAILK
jgi:phage gpG-like protein